MQESRIDGLVLALGPLGSGVRLEGDWDGAFGGEISLLSVRERRWLVAAGLAVGGMRFAERDAGLLWADLLAAARGPFGVPVGLSVGANLEVDRQRRARPGVQSTFWIFAGVVPFVRAARVRDLGTVIDVGIKVVLPAIRWN